MMLYATNNRIQVRAHGDHQLVFAMTKDVRQSFVAEMIMKTVLSSSKSRGIDSCSENKLLE